MAAHHDKSPLAPVRTKPGPADSKASLDNNDIGKALRSIYDDALTEDVPSEMLDLLGKLG